MRTLNRIRAAIAKLSKILLVGRYRIALLRGVAAAVEHERVIRDFNCKFVADIGANRGQFSLVSRHCYPDAGIVAFEPLPPAYSGYRKVFKGDDQTVGHQSAIGEIEGTTPIHVSSRDDSSSLLPIGSAQSKLFPGTEESHVETIAVAPLDRFLTPADIRQPALLKIDVQGYELNALRGCASLIKYFRWAYVECSFVELYSGQALAHEVIEYLAAKEFRLTGVHNLVYSRDGKAVQGDFLFERAEAQLFD